MVVSDGMVMVVNIDRGNDNLTGSAPLQFVEAVNCFFLIV
jgi:hypothetical protein